MWIKNTCFLLIEPLPKVREMGIEKDRVYSVRCKVGGGEDGDGRRNVLPVIGLSSSLSPPLSVTTSKQLVWIVMRGVKKTYILIVVVAQCPSTKNYFF